jgi:hypothetical protein
VGPQAVWTQVRAVLGTLEREVAEMEKVRQRLPREFDALMAGLTRPGAARRLRPVRSPESLA